MAENTAKSAETLGFQAEVKQLLHLVTHSLYSNKEIFLRELISNASDALDKLRFLALENDALFEGDADLQIQVDIDKEQRTVTITDNGVGMTRDEVISNLGTIARSGTSEFLRSLSGDQSKDNQLIGQFGVGFYSAFIIADKVTVITRKAGESVENAVKWQSDGSGEFTIETVNKSNHGTQIICHLKTDEDEFLDEWKVKNTITKYSDHIAFPVLMQEAVQVETESDEADSKESENAEEVTTETAYEYKAINKAKALWAASKSEISDEEYKEFYKHISHDFDDPMIWSHNRVEGKTEYTSLLYIPKHAPFDLWNRDAPKGLKLYVKRVFIMDNAEKLLPLYLRFIKGVIDSDDLPLNVSRELLQNNRVIETIRSATTKRVLTMLEKCASNDPEQYLELWKAFGNVLKEGPAEDAANRDQIAKLFRFATTKSEGDAQTVSLADYVSRMPETQEMIYYITADSHAAASNSPHLEIFKQKGIEVILMYDKVDEWLISNLSEFEGKSIVSVAKGDLDLGELEDEETKEAHKQVETENKDFIERMQKVLGDTVKEVRITHRLTNSPSCVVADTYDMSANIQRILKASGQDVPTAKPILELNPQHELVNKLKSVTDDTQFADWSHVLLDQAILAEGGQLTDPASFVSRLNQFLLKV